MSCHLEEYESSIHAAIYKKVWENCARRFEERWGFPNCLGSIDGKHVFIKCPDNAGSLYYDYLKRHSIVLLAIVGPEYEFLCVDIGAYGRNSDGGIFEESQIDVYKRQL